MSTTVQGSHQAHEWNRAIVALNGDILQGWEWGEFKARHGWRVERLSATVGESQASAQILFRQRGPVSLAYIPRGPVFTPDQKALPTLLEQIDACCRRHRAIALYIDPDHPLPLDRLNQGCGFSSGLASIQTPRTIKVGLGSDNSLQAQMRRDTRANLNVALRQGATASVVEPTPEHRDIFYGLMMETSERKGFGIHTRAYYEEFLDIYGDDAALILTERDSRVTHALIAVASGTQGRSMYSGSSGEHRGRGDAVLLRLAAMQWARDRGCTDYDLGGIAPGASSSNSAHDLQRDVSLQGVDQFKLGFGGTLVTYPETLERCYRPALVWLLRRFYPRFRTSGMDEPTLS